MPEKEQNQKHEMTLEERLLDEQNQQMNDHLKEEIPPTYSGPKVIFKSGIPGLLGGFKIEHEVIVKGSVWEDIYKRVPEKGKRKATVPYVKV